MKNSLTTLGLASVLALGVSTSNAQDSSTVDTVVDAATSVIGGVQCTDETGCLIAGIRFGNPMDPSTWWNANEGSKAGAVLAVNFMDPEFYTNFMNPEMRGEIHAAFLNPASWAQFLEMETYTAMMDPAVMMKWFDIESYDAILDPQNYAYFMQPGAYEHLIDVDHYLQFTQLEAYTPFWEAATSTLGLSE